MKHNIDEPTLQTAIDEALLHTLANVENFVSTCFDMTPLNSTWEVESHVRLHLLKSVLDLLPEPTPPVELEAFRSFFGRASIKLNAIDGKGDNGSTEDFLQRLNAVYGFAATSEEADAIGSLVQSQGLTASQVLRQALRHYQMAIQGQPMPPPVVDGKTPAHVAFNAMVSSFKLGENAFVKWEDLSAEEKAVREIGASAVLAAFGGQASLDAAIARMEAVPPSELARLIYDSKDQPFAAASDVLARLIAAARNPVNLEAAIGATPGSFAKTCDDPKTGELPVLSGDTDLRAEWLKLLGYSSNTGAFYRVSKDSQFYSASTEQAFQAWLSKQPSTKPAEIPWIAWHGGPCPLKDEEVEEWEAMTRLGIKHLQRCKPSAHPAWGGDGVSAIIAYRVLKWREGCGPVPVDRKAKSNPWEEEARKYCEDAIFWRGKAEKAEAELARVRHIYDSRIIEGSEQPQLSRLRPIAEAGPVPEGCVRFNAQFCANNKWYMGVDYNENDTHYADIYLPEASQPDSGQVETAPDMIVPDPAEMPAGFNSALEIWDAAMPDEFIAPAKADPYAELKTAHAAGKVIQARAYGEWHDEDFTSCKMEDFSLNFLRIKPESATFEAHGKIWTRHTPGDPMPCKMDRFIFILVKGGEVLKGNTTNFGYWGESCPENDQIIGWRYADEPTPEPSSLPLTSTPHNKPPFISRTHS